MSSHHFPHPYQNPEYAPPVLRAPSPASSVGTAYGPDQTSFSDSEQQLSQEDFEKKWLAKLNLDKPRREGDENGEEWDGEDGEGEERSWDPLVWRGKTKDEENAIVEKIMKNLRAKIRQLEEDEMFEQTLLKGSQVGLESRPTTNDIDALMKSMMGTSMSLNEGHVGDDTLTDGPWNTTQTRGNLVFEGHSGVGMESLLGGMTTSSTVGKRTRSGKSRKVK